MTNRSFSLAPMSQSLRRVALLFGLAAVYYFAAKLGLRFAYINSSVTTIWPPTGIALAAFVLLGYRVWPAILGAAFLANFATTGAVLPSIGIAIGNTAEGLLGAYLVNRFARGGRVFNRVRDILRFTLLAALVSTVVSATIGILSLLLGGLVSWSDVPRVWLTWWVGDGAGVCVGAPAGWDRGHRGHESRARGRRRRAARAAGHLAGAGRHGSADGTRQSSPAGAGARRRDQALAPHRAAARGGAARPRRPEADQRSARPPRGEPRDPARGRGAARLVPRDRHGRPVRRRRVRARAPGDGGSGGVARGARGVRPVGDGRREAELVDQCRGGRLPRARRHGRGPAKRSGYRAVRDAGTP